jgi:hypothetical protein
MDGDSIAALKSLDPVERETGALLLRRQLEARHVVTPRLLRGCNGSVTTDDLRARVLVAVVTRIDQ